MLKPNHTLLLIKHLTHAKMQSICEGVGNLEHMPHLACQAISYGTQKIKFDIPILLRFTQEAY